MIAARESSADPGQVPPAGLAVDQRVLLAQLLEPLGRDCDAASPAERGVGYLGDGGPPMAQDLVVVTQDDGGKLVRERHALPSDHGQLGLEAAKQLTECRLLSLALGPTLLELTLSVPELGAQALLRLHEREDLLLDARFLLLDFVDLDEDGRVLLVGLDLVELALELLPLHTVVLEVLFLRALALARGIELRLDALDALARLVDLGVHLGDLHWQLGHLRLDPADFRVEHLEIDQRLELRVQDRLTRAKDPSSSRQGERTAGRRPGRPPTVLGPLGLEPRPNRL